MNIYETVTNTIIEKIQNCNIPWQRPWNTVHPINYCSRKNYQGINSLILEPGEYATFNQIKDLGGHLNRGSKSQVIAFYKIIEKEEKIFPLLRYSNVFNIKDTNLVSKIQNNNFKIEISNFKYENYLKIEIDTYCNKAIYNAIQDIIKVPKISQFKTIESFYATKYHELIHSTGHPNKLNRFSIDKYNPKSEYSFEELTAEIGANMLLSHNHISINYDNSASYINSWLQVLKNDKTIILKAASAAQKAVNYILAFEDNSENNLETEVE